MTRIISDKIQEYCGERFYLCGNYYQHKGRRLHRVIWEHYHGAIPYGYDVHHIDGDRSNNNIKNLMLLPRSIHHALHMSDENRKIQSRKSIKIASAHAKEWHKSKAGLEWHSKQGKDNYLKRKINTYVCKQCGKEYQTKQVYGMDINTFCSNKCKSAYRRKSGVDNEIRYCNNCDKPYTTNKYSKKIYCSHECYNKARWDK